MSFKENKSLRWSSPIDVVWSYISTLIKLLITLQKSLFWLAHLLFPTGSPDIEGNIQSSSHPDHDSWIPHE